MAKERIKKKKRNNDIFESSSGISEAWCLTGMEAPFPKGIQSVDINRLSVDTRDVSWLSLVCDRWEDRFRILLLVSLISTLTPLQVYVRESTYASEQRTEERKETEREREKEREVVRRKVAHDRSGTDLWFDLERHESGRPRIRWNDLVSFVVSLTRERYTTPDRNTTGEARKRYVASVLGPLGFSNGAINNWQQILFYRLHQLINSSSFCTNDTSIRRYFN